jgi:hypothetical protein
MRSPMMLQQEHGGTCERKMIERKKQEREKKGRLSKRTTNTMATSNYFLFNI